MMSYTGWSLRRRGSFVLALTAGLVVLGDWLFYERQIGWSASLFGLALLLAVVLRGPGLWRGRGRAWWVVASATMGVILALVLQPSVLAVGLGLVGLVMLAVIDRAGWTWSVGRWVLQLGRFVGRAAVQWAHDSKIAQRWRRSHPSAETRRSGRRALAWVVPVLISGVFVGLFAVANPLVQRQLQRLGEWLEAQLTGIEHWLDPPRILFWIATAAAAWGLLRARPIAQRAKRTPVVSGDEPLDLTDYSLGRWLSVGLVVRCLVLLNLVFAVQSAMDLVYLFGGAALPEGMTYAEYAHRGAYPLVGTALLAGALMLFAFRPGGVAQRSGWCRRLVAIWIAQNLLLMVSAGWRLNLYVSAYSLTRWRVAAAVWMLLVAVGFVFLVWRIAANRDSAWLLRRVTVSAAAVLYALCFVDVDGRIAAFNVGHCAEAGGPGPAIDLAYLQELGPEALPAMDRLLAAASLSAETRQNAGVIHRRLEQRLDQRLDDWRGWTLRHHWLSRAIVAHDAEVPPLDAASPPAAPDIQGERSQRRWARSAG